MKKPSQLTFCFISNQDNLSNAHYLKASATINSLVPWP